MPAEVAGQPAEDANFCWQEIQRTQPGLRLTLQYVPKDRRLQLLGVYAWLSAIEHTVSDTSEAHVARMKLGWWHRELLAGEPARSQHPIVRTLQRSGALRRLNPELFAEELRLASIRTERPTFRDATALEDFAAALGINHLKFELSLEGRGTDLNDRPPGAPAVNGLMHLFRETTRSQWLGCWWFPLDLCARHGIQKHGGIEDLSSESVHAGVVDLAGMAGNWGALCRNIGGFGRTAGNDRDSLRSHPRHWLILWRLHGLQMRRIEKHESEGLAESCRPARARDAWRIWRFARALKEAE